MDEHGGGQYEIEGEGPVDWAMKVGFLADAAMIFETPTFVETLFLYSRVATQISNINSNQTELGPTEISRISPQKTVATRVATIFCTMNFEVREEIGRGEILIPQNPRSRYSRQKFLSRFR